MLKDLRADISKKEKLPPYLIFQDPALEDMSIQYPVSLEDMQQINGVGSGKAAKYAQPFLDLIAKYIEENEITPPRDLVIKQTAKPEEQSGVFIIQNIDRKVPFKDIASRKGITFEELLSQIEKIVNSGTKLNIDYYLYDNVDEDVIEEILCYFKEDAGDDDSLETAMKELGDDYSAEEVRLVRIKYLSDRKTSSSKVVIK